MGGTSWRDVACGIVAPAGGASKSDVEGEEACFEDEWGGFVFGTGKEEQDDTEGVER